MYFTADKRDIELSVGEILDSMGYQGTVPDDYILEQIRKFRQEALDLLEARYVYKQVEGFVASDALNIQDEMKFGIGRIIARCLRDSECFCFFIATAGVEIQNWINKYREKGEILDFYIADSVGSALIEKVADYMQAKIKEEMSLSDLRISNRYSPGYCGWNIAEQQILFQLMGNNTCGVTLSPSSLMYPVKSVSGVIGAGKNIRYMEYGCGICNQANCFRRKK